jgi:uncharacterized protein
MGKSNDPFYVLSLDGGGSLGVYTLGVLKQVEGFILKTEKIQLHDKFKLVYGTSTGSIIASLIAMGKNVDEISDLYFHHVPDIMGIGSPSKKTKALIKCASEVFKEEKFTEKDEVFKTSIGVVATDSTTSKPIIFKSHAKKMVQEGQLTAEDGFECTIADAVVSSCSAYPFFEKPIIKVGNPHNKNIEMLDGGYCGNNPTLFAIIDAKKILEQQEESGREIRVLNIGVGSYVYKNTSIFEKLLRKFNPVGSKIELFENSLAISSNTIEIIRGIVFRETKVERISVDNVGLSTNLMESDIKKLTKIKDFGSNSYLAEATRKRIEELLSIVDGD